MKRTLSTILLISMLASLSACGGTEVGSDDTTVAGGDDTIADTTPAETTEAPRPDLPELDLEDYVLRVFKQDQSKILWAPNAFAPEEENGDILNDAYYKRNRVVTEKYGFTIEETISSSNPNSTVTSNILAGDDVCDVLLTHLNLANTSYGGNYLNWHDLEYVDLEKEWWDQSLVRDMTIDGNLCIMSGDIIISSRNDSAIMLIYNRPMADDFQLENVYDIVREGKWTYDKMYQLMDKVAADLDDETTKDDRDRYGVVYSGGDVGQPWFAAANVRLFENNDGDIKLTAEAERAHNAFEVIQKIVTNKTIGFDQSTFKSSSKTNMAMMTEKVANKTALFLVMSPGTVQRAEYRAIETEFGMVPMPKLDEKQESYMTSLGNAAINMYLPVTISEPEKVGYILEALCRGSDELVETYFSRCLEGKFSRDEDSYEMMRLACDSVIYDMGYQYNFGDIGNQVKNALCDSSRNYASTIASVKTAAQTAAADFLAKLEK